MARYFSPKPPPSNSRKIRGLGEKAGKAVNKAKSPKKSSSKGSIKSLPEEYEANPLVVRVMKRGPETYLVGPYRLTGVRGNYLLALPSDRDNLLVYKIRLSAHDGLRPVAVRKQDIRFIHSLTQDEVNSVKTFHEVFGDHQHHGLYAHNVQATKV